MSQYLIQQQFNIDQHQSGKRLDQCVAQQFPDFSRSKIQAWIKQGYIQINNQGAQAKQKVVFGTTVSVLVPIEKQIEDQAEAIDFDIVYQDESVFIINKPIGLVVHPAAGHQTGTLLNGLLAIDKNLEQLPRAGIVHRLDKDTSGLMMVARTLQAHHFLVDQLQQRLVSREYRAITQGVLTAGRTIEEPIDRHPKDRKKMAVVSDGREAITHFSVRHKYKNFSEIDVKLETGRTHQIRVHLAHLRHPLVGDPVYGGRLTLPKAISDDLKDFLYHFRRQALHAKTLSFTHPQTQQWVSFSSELPDDMQQLIALIKASDERNHA